MAYYDNLPPGCTVADIERQAGVEEDESTPRPGLSPELWDDDSWENRDGAASERAVSDQALAVLRQMMGLPSIAPAPVQ